MKWYINTRTQRNGVVVTLEEFESTDYPKWIDFGRLMNERLQKYRRDDKSAYISQWASVAWANRGKAVPVEKNEGDKVYVFQVEYSDSPKMDCINFTNWDFQCKGTTLKDAYTTVLFHADDAILKRIYGKYYSITFIREVTE